MGLNTKADPMQELTEQRCTDEKTVAELGPVEKEIALLVIERLCAGAEDYGPWRLDDPRDNCEEALEELIDAMHYVAAEVVRLRHHRSRPGGRSRMQRVYTCHRFSSDMAGAAKSLRRICRELVQENCVPICPQLLLPEFIHEDNERDLAMRLCQEMLRACDEVRVYGSGLTPGMRVEISFAELLGIPVRYVSSAAEVP